MTTFDHNEIYKRICEELDFQGRIPTIQLLKMLGYSSMTRNEFRQHLYALKALGVIQKHGDKRYSWTVKQGWQNVLDSAAASNGGMIPTPPQPDDATGHIEKMFEASNERIKHLGEELMKVIEERDALKAASGVDPMVMAAATKTIDELQKKIEVLEKEAKETVKTIIIKRVESKSKLTMKDSPIPKVFERVLDLASGRMNVLLVGPAGCGKTFLAKLISKALKLKADFGSISCTSGMTETALLGRSIPNISTGKGKYQRTEFVRCYEEGGLFLLDELDAADSNILLAINSALANGQCNLPNRPEKPYAMRHKDFTLIGTANTYGRGADRVYAGRNQLDEATLDRFRIGMIDCDYDPTVEKALCPDDSLRHSLQDIRGRIDAAGLRRIMSTRFIEDAYFMQKNFDWDLKKILQGYFEGWTREERSKAAPTPSTSLS